MIRTADLTRFRSEVGTLAETLSTPHNTEGQPRVQLSAPVRQWPGLVGSVLVLGYAPGMDHPGALVAGLFCVSVAIVLLFVRRRMARSKPSEPQGVSVHEPEPWPRDFLPLVVTASPEALMLARQIQRAMVWWNRKSGLDLFFPVVLDLNREEADRANLVHISMSLEDLKPMLTVSVEDQEGVRGPVSLPPVANDDVLERVVARELGRVLGLERDTRDDSVMGENLGGDYVYTITDEHMCQLRKWYGMIS